MCPNSTLACPPFPDLRCVIFDLDGTLVRTNELIYASFNHLMERHLGRRMEPAEIVALFGPPEEGAIEKVFGPERTPALMKELLEFYAAQHSTLADMHEGIEELLRFLKERGIRIALFTGKGRWTTGITLGAFGLDGYFDLIVTGNDVERHKPDPEGIRLALDRFGLRPSQALMVGDSVSDAKAGHAAGVRVASVLWDAHDPERVRAVNSTCTFDSVASFDAWLRAQL
ncbi:MAG: Phosphoglycolate phosphatase [candidate division NC10 bacterium]|nr:Phosphoglycolate phosphatase [candidate division NC10 bacterium]